MSLIKKKANDNIANRAIKYQIFPTLEQASQMARTFGCARLVYNLGIEMLDGLYAAGFGYMGYMSLNNYCTRVWKAEMPFLKEVDKFALNNSLMNLDVGYQRLFEKASGHPKYKSRKDSEQSYTTNMTNGNIKLVLPSKKGSKGKIQLPKLGLVDACIYRLPKKDWVIKQATVSKDCRGKYSTLYGWIYLFMEKHNIWVQILERISWVMRAALAKVCDIPSFLSLFLTEFRFPFLHRKETARFRPNGCGGGLYFPAPHNSEIDL